MKTIDRGQAARLLFAVPMVIYLALNVYSYWAADTQKLIDIYEDDAYYYFKVAYNLATGEGLTFDGQSVSNGFHPLWMLAIMPIYLFQPDRLLALRIIGTLSSLLIGIAGYIGFRRLMKLPFSIFGLSLLFFAFSMVMISNSGMETALLLPLLIGALMRIDEASGKGDLLTGLLLALALLARLDAILLLAGLGLVYIAENPRRRHALIALPLIALALFLAANLLLTDHLVPTSGTVKGLQSEGVLLNIRFLRQLTVPGSTSEGYLWSVLGLGFVLSLAAVLFRLGDLRRKPWREVVSSQPATLTSAVFYIVFILYYLTRSSWVLWRWYTYPLVLYSLFVAPALLHRLRTRLMQYAQLWRRVEGAMIVAVWVGLILLVAASWKSGNWSQAAHRSFMSQNYSAAQLMNAELAPGSILAIGDRAGSLAYFYDGDVLQLEGLMGDYALIDSIADDRLVAYMDDFGVDYLVSFRGPQAGYQNWVLTTPLGLLTSAPQAEIPICRSSEFLSFADQVHGLYVWRWPSCPSD
jgi:hypothetical protein